MSARKAAEEVILEIDLLAEKCGRNGFFAFEAFLKTMLLSVHHGCLDELIEHTRGVRSSPRCDPGGRRPPAERKQATLNEQRPPPVMTGAFAFHVDREDSVA